MGLQALALPLLLVVALTLVGADARAGDESPATPQVSDAPPKAADDALRARVEQMKPEERKQLRAQVTQLQQMTPEERSELRDRIARMEIATPAERARLEANIQRWIKMSPPERDRLRERWRRFEELPAAERERILRARDAQQDAQSQPKP